MQPGRRNPDIPLRPDVMGCAVYFRLRAACLKHMYPPPPPTPLFPILDEQLPRHGASCPVGIGVSCSADRQALGKITAEGVFLEALEKDVGQYLPEVDEAQISPEVWSWLRNKVAQWLFKGGWGLRVATFR